jgi:hypothetical protein
MDPAVLKIIAVVRLGVPFARRIAPTPLDNQRVHVHLDNVVVLRSREQLLHRSVDRDNVAVVPPLVRRRNWGRGGPTWVGLQLVKHDHVWPRLAEFDHGTE